MAGTGIFQAVWIVKNPHLLARRTIEFVFENLVWQKLNQRDRAGHSGRMSFRAGSLQQFQRCVVLEPPPARAGKFQALYQSSSRWHKLRPESARQMGSRRALDERPFGPVPLLYDLLGWRHLRKWPVS